MRFIHKFPTLSLALSLMMSITVPAQNLPALKSDAALQTGSFPNGIKYMIVANKDAKGYADYTLVQKSASDAAIARQALSSLPHFQEQKPYEFLSAKGVGYGPEGLYHTDGRAGIFRFTDVPVSDVAASDSTLMMIFDLCTINPYEQAVIISGDVDAANLKGKMSIFSMMVPARDKAPKAEKYEWQPSSDVDFVSTRNHYENLTSLTFTYAVPRTPDAQLKTVQVLVTERLFAELGIIVKRRIGETFAAEDIPLAGVDAVYMDGSAGYGDESFSVTVHISKDDILRSSAAVSKVLANIDKAGVSPSEFSEARSTYMNDEARRATVRSNAEYTDLCIASYLHGTVVRATGSELDFFSKKELPADSDAALFNKFASNLLDSYENLSVKVDSPLESVSRDRVLDAFMFPWSRSVEAGERHVYISHAADTLKLAEPGEKVKLKSEVADPLSGGTVWTFSNGIRVVYKQAVTPGRFNYSFMVRGGYGTAGALATGEGAFVSDLMDCYDVAGMKADDFNAMLRANGVVMFRKVGVSDLRIEGSAPSDRLSLVVRSVVSYINHHRFNEAVYDRRLKAERLRVEMDMDGDTGLLAAVDRVMRPDFTYTPYKMPEHVPSGLASKMSGYLSSQAHKMNDGVIVISGDVPADQVQRLFLRYAGSLMVSKVQAQRPHAPYQLHSSISTNGRTAPHEGCTSATIAMAATVPVTKERYLTFGLAGILIKERLAAELGAYGLSAGITPVVEFSPLESYCLVVTVRPVPVQGLPEGMTPPDTRTSLDLLRDALAKVMTEPVSDKTFKIIRPVFLKQLEYEMTRPEQLVEAVVARYSEGKDLVSTYKTTVNALTPAMLNDLLATLWNGARVEYLMDNE